MQIKSNKSASIFPLLWVMLFDHTSLNIAFPILTLLFFDVQSHLFAPGTSHAVRSMWYGVCAAIPHVVNLVMTPLLSALSDEYGRKKILLVGTLGALLFALTAALGVVFGLLSLLLLGRFIQGAFSRTNPIAQAVIGDISTRENKIRNMGYLQLSISLGAFIGPIIGGYFANQFYFSTLNFSLPYFIATLFAGISCLLTLFFFDETHTVRSKPTLNYFFNLAALKKVFFQPQVLRISAMLLLSQISWSMYYQFIPPILKTALGFKAHALGIFVGLEALWLALATGFGIKFLQNFFDLKKMLMLSLYLVLAGLVLSVLFCLLPAKGYSLLIWLAAIPTAVGDVIAYSCLTTLYSDGVLKEEQGKVMGICFIVVALIWSLTALLGGVIMSFNVLMPLILAPVGIVISIILLHSSLGKQLFSITH
ncbi:MAG: MFS transporter [Gammaproteobacteria bacterium]|nr:MFS transporter [Gammaproteobacteria bacterium]